MTLHLELDLTVYLLPLHDRIPLTREEMLNDLREWVKRHWHVCQGNTVIELTEKDILDVEEVQGAEDNASNHLSIP